MPHETATETPFGPIGRQVNKMMEQMQKGYFGFSHNETWSPNVNLYETERSYRVCVDLAGVVKEEIDVVVVDHQLTLKGTRAMPAQPVETEVPQAKMRVHLMEIDHGPFSRDVELPHNVLQEQITATYRNGMLWIELPKV